MTPISQRRKLRLGQSVKLAQDHTARKSGLQGWVTRGHVRPRPSSSSLGLPPPRTLFLTLSSLPTTPQICLQILSHSHLHSAHLQFFIFCQKPIALSRSPISSWDLPSTDQKPGCLPSSPSPTASPTHPLNLCPAFCLNWTLGHTLAPLNPSSSFLPGLCLQSSPTVTNKAPLFYLFIYL